MLDYILKIKKKSDYSNAIIVFIVFKLLSFTLSYNKEAGDHLSLSAGIGPFELGLNLSIWRKLLPWMLGQ